MKKESVVKIVKKKIEVKVPKKYEPKEFFITRTCLYVWSGFSEYILKKAKVITVTSFNISSFDLITCAYDKEIESELPKKHLFTETEVCGVIAGLIEKQSKGESGTLLNNGYGNIFYTKSRVVDVGWDSGYGEWYVSDWSRGVDSWLGGRRVFSSATEI